MHGAKIKERERNMLIETRKEITKEEFEHLTTRDLDEFYDYIKNIAARSAYHPAGYSFLMPKIMHIDGKYYASWQHYDTCD